MVLRRDVENFSTADERAPLLASQRSEANSTAEPVDDEVSKYQQERSLRRGYAWRGFWIVVVILVIAVFVKGWIESDEVEVCRSLPHRRLINGPNNQRSSTSREL